jgi:hypothetical protein
MDIGIPFHVLQYNLIRAIVPTEYSEIRKTVNEYIRDLVHFELNAIVDHGVGKVQQVLRHDSDDRASWLYVFRIRHMHQFFGDGGESKDSFLFG